MVKSREATSASVNIKEKKSLLDDEIGQDFLSSWKSMSVTQDDAMDFNFGTVLSGKEKTFNFDKLDMDFNLDGDFNKLSSFKVDMPDLDFPCPSKKTAKPKERTEDSSTGNCKGKKGHFSFSFDFNDEDFANDVQFGSNLFGSSESLTRELANDEPVFLKSEKNVKELSNIREDFNSDGVQNGSKVVSDFRPLDEQGLKGEPNLLSSEKNAGEDLHDNDAPIGGQLGGNSKSPTREIRNWEPGSPISENNVKNFSNIREGFDSDGSQLDGDLRSLNKQVIQAEPAMLRSEKNSGEDLHANDVQIGNQSRDNLKSVGSDLTEGEPVLLRSDNSLKNLSIIREAFESNGEQNGSKLVGNIRLQDKQAAIEESLMPGSENNTGEDFNTNDAQVGQKLVVLESPSRELTETELVLEEIKKNDKNLSNIRKGINNDGVQVGSKFGDNSRCQEKEAITGKSTQLRSDKSSMEDLRANDVQIRNQSIDNSKSISSDLTEGEPVLLRSDNSVKNLSNIRKGVNTDGVQVGSKFGSNSKSEKTETTIVKPVKLRSDNSSREDLCANDVQSRNQLLDNSKSVSGDLTDGELGLLRCGNNVKNLSNIREAFESDGQQNGSKLVSNIRLQDKQAAKEESVMPGWENNTGKGLNIDGVQVGSKFGGNSRSQKKETTIAKPVQLRSDKSSIFQASPSSQTEKIAKSSTQASGNPKFVISSLESIRNLKNHSAEGHKIGKRTPELSSLKTLRTAGAKRDIPNSTVLRQNNSLRNWEQNTKLASNTTSKIACPVDGIDKQKPLTPSLKRKISEESNADLVLLKPLKRLSESPKESRSFKESLGKAVEEETCNNENQAESRTKNVLHDQPASRLKVSEEVDMTEIEIPFVMENDGNVEKAEAYMKGLEDICSMLKKKHEEAKEVLVRAVVNNNNLLILNHPIYEEKIHMVQDFATQLTLKEIPVDR